jgi:hypothetical protein
MRKIAERFPGAFLVFSALKNDLHDEERTAIAELAAWGREPMNGGGRPRAPVIVLTGAELFAPYRVDDSWRRLGGLRQELADASHMHLENLWGLADATQQVYLGMKSRSTELMERWEAERLAAEVRPAVGKPRRPGGIRKATQARKVRAKGDSAAKGSSS